MEDKLRVNWPSVEKWCDDVDVDDVDRKGGGQIANSTRVDCRTLLAVDCVGG
jgi:hypothetical protein